MLNLLTTKSLSTFRIERERERFRVDCLSYSPKTKTQTVLDDLYTHDLCMPDSCVCVCAMYALYPIDDNPVLFSFLSE